MITRIWTLSFVMLSAVLPTVVLSLSQNRASANQASPNSDDSGDPINVTLRSQEQVEDTRIFLPRVQQQAWDPQKSAVIVCDMWDSHHCYRAVQRATEMAPRMNRFLQQLRRRGVTIIHAPSGCMQAYENDPARHRAKQEPLVSPLPVDIANWCYSIDSESKVPYPIDQSDGGEDDTPEEHRAWHQKLMEQGRDPAAPWKRQMDAIEIDSSRDFISDRGDEIWSLLKNHSIENVMLVGVHTNMCVLGRPFGLRRLASNGINTVLVRDLTDTMYNPAAKPYVSHFTGTDLIIQYIERTVCPTISSDQILGGKAFRFSKDQRPTIAMMIGESEYETAITLPAFAVQKLGIDYRVRYILESVEDQGSFIGFDELDSADMLLVSVRRKTLPPGQLQQIQQFVAAGKPVLGIRTASHAFCLRKQDAPEGRSDWPEFDAQVFGGHYTDHHPNGLRSTVVPSSQSTQSESARWLKFKPFQQGGSLYKVRPLESDASVLAIGRAEGIDDEPVAWTYRRQDGGLSFYTSLGHWNDFSETAFVEMLQQAIKHLSANRNIP
ncbi:isochorismatase family protein [Rhodopirellula sp. MGV]|uniref:isochorismatase family protein n=1 Tax=Rhodopirellula sp. MGV TaxID=2023130 RepID=UPI000B979545|nr:isochorismatase family protein [Rhodopirellula sp. MGV]OYP35177.1 hypothetical protein CGZ80_12315 [Rhodopirellula sp. MGV]PNY37809.1 nicotinamidase [Rhodopirellula baltica]